MNNIDEKCWPKISIMIAARNEKDNIEICLESILRLQYPEDKIQVLIGDDASDDDTFEIIKKFCAANPHFECFSFINQENVSTGKVNILIELQKKATGDFYLFTDADVVLPPNWAIFLVNKFKKKVGIVTGVTILKGDSWFAKLQSLEWLYTFFVIRLVSFFHIPVTSIGNNMAISKVAYLQAKGFETLENCLVEDFKIFHKIVEQGFNFVQCFHTDIIIETIPKNDFFQVLNQRKRWMIGAKQLPFIFQLFNYSSALYFPLMLGLGFINLSLVINIFIVKYLIVSFLALIALTKSKQFGLVVFVPFFDIYLSFIYFSMFFYDLFNAQIEWKGRFYKQ